MVTGRMSISGLRWLFSGIRWAGSGCGARKQAPSPRAGLGTHGDRSMYLRVKVTL